MFSYKNKFCCRKNKLEASENQYNILVLKHPLKSFFEQDEWCSEVRDPLKSDSEQGGRPEVRKEKKLSIPFLFLRSRGKPSEIPTNKSKF